MDILKYFLVVNIVSACVCFLDKYNAKNGGRRVSEKTLFFLSAVGGSVFMYITMRLIRHKTLHKRFMIGLPVMMFIQAFILIIFYIFY